MVAVCISVVAFALVASAGDVYVDCSAAAGGDGSAASPYRTVQAAVDAAAAGDVIHVAAGTYSEGGRQDGFSHPMLNRVYVDKSLTICGAVRERTVILGRRATNAEDSAGLGLGSDAVRCIGINASNVVISNLTITGGATQVPTENDDPNGNGGGVYARTGLTGVYIVDCIVSNNVANRAGAMRYGNDSVHSMTAVRTRIHGNRALDRDPATRGMTLVHCLVTHHASSWSLSYSGTFVNCTFADNWCRALGEAAVTVKNCLIADRWYKADMNAAYMDCAIPVDESSVTDVATDCLFNAGCDQFVAPVTGDFRLNASANVIGRGSMAHLESLSIDAVYKHVDFFGNAIDPSSTVCNIGCGQSAVTPVGGTVRFASIPVADSAVGGYAYSLNPNNRYLFNGSDEPLIQSGLAYARATEWPVSIKVTVEPSVWAGVYGLDAAGADTVRRYPYLDGTYEIVPPQDPSETLTLTPIRADAVLHVKQGPAVETEDGTEVSPYRDLQTAIDAAQSGKNTIVLCDGGVFDSGSVRQMNLSCRIGFSGKNIRIVGIGGAERNIIVGGVDGSAAIDEWPYGMGDGAVRCLYLGGTSAIQGFTLTGGRTACSGDDNAWRGAAAFLASGAQITDCVISNNVGCQGVAVNGTEIGKTPSAYAFRCLITGNRQYDRTLHTESGSGLLRSVIGAFLVVSGNTGPVSGSYEWQRLYNCSIYSEAGVGINIMSANVTNYNCALHLTAAKLNGPVICGGVAKFTVGEWRSGSSSVVRADPLFAAPVALDLRPGSVSAARTYGTFDVADAGYHTYIMRDFYGNPMRLTDGRPLCGAVQDFAPTVVMMDNGISPSGTNVFATAGAEIAYTATLPRPFLGFLINGETQRVDGVTYRFAVPQTNDYSEPYVISAIYDSNWYVDAAKGDDSGIGTSASPKWTLSGALVNAVSGDVVHVASGVYGDGEMVHSRKVISGTSSIEIGCRAHIPEGVSVVSQGSAADTFIVGSAATSPVADAQGCGAGAVRGVMMEKGARLSGFTVTGGHTGATSENVDDATGGGVLARDNTAIVSDCIISNNVAVRGGGAFNGTYLRCRFLQNAVVSGGNGAAVRGDGGGDPSNPATALLRNCIVAGNAGWATVYIASAESCTFAADNSHNGATAGNTILNVCPQVRNSLILGDKRAEGRIGLQRCVMSAEMLERNTRADKTGVFTTNSCLIAATDDELAVDGGYAPVIGKSIAVDAGDISLYDVEASGTSDVYGNPRAVNGARMDVGAVEAVWLATYATALGVPFSSVTAASPDVLLTDSGVSIPNGASLCATVGKRNGAGRIQIVATASVADGGTCEIRYGDASLATLSAGDAQEVRYRPAADYADFAFLAHGAETVLSSIRTECGFMVVIR